MKAAAAIFVGASLLLVATQAVRDPVAMLPIILAYAGAGLLWLLWSR